MTNQEEQLNKQSENMCPHGNFSESCELCKAKDNRKIDTQETKGQRTKKEAQQELEEKFGIRDTTAFRQALEQGKINTAKEWLQYIVDNQEQFPQYQATWDNWLKNRKQEISQQILFEKFEMGKTNDFRQAIKQGKIEEAEEWLEYIIDNKDQFPQYNDDWFNDRRKELEQA